MNVVIRCIAGNNQAGSVSGTAIYTDQFNAGGSLANVTIDANTFTNNTNAAVLLGSTNAALGDTNVTISNNLMDGNGNAMLLFNTHNSLVTGNTISNSVASQLVLGGGVNGLQVTQNFIQNGATRGIRVSRGSGAPKEARWTGPRA